MKEQSILLSKQQNTLNYIRKFIMHISEFITFI